MVIDVITYNGEKDLFDLRYNILRNFVDEFIVVEAPTTFSGKEKPLYFQEIKDKYDRVKYYINDENYTPEEIAQAEQSPNTKGASHWKHEFMQKERIKKATEYLKDDDLVFIGDCDEIWDTDYNFNVINNVMKLKLRVYTYWLNNRSSEEFWGTIVGKYGLIKNECLNHLRVNAHKTNDYYGWHFTSMGGFDEVKRKLSDSYTRESYWTPEVERQLEHNLLENRDFLGRGFHYKLDESHWPTYLKNNKQKYAQFIK